MNVLKKDAVIIGIPIILIFILILGSLGKNSTPEEANDTLTTTVNYQPKEGEVIGYYLDRENFQKFLLKPSVEFLLSKQDNLGVYSKSTRKDGYIQLRIFASNQTDPIHDDEAISGYFRIASWPVYSEFIDFMNDIENFKQILAEHDIEEKILYYAIITYRYSEPKGIQPTPPGTQHDKMCIWIHADAGEYFLEFNAYLSEDPLDTNFTYDFYDLAGYSQKYGSK